MTQVQNLQQNISDYYLPDGEPIKCIHCHSEDIITKQNGDSFDGTIETEYYCHSCDRKLAESAYGIFATTDAICNHQ